MPDRAAARDYAPLDWVNAEGRPIISPPGNVLRVIRATPKTVLLENAAGRSFRRHKSALANQAWCLARSEADIAAAKDAVSAARRECKRLQEDAELRADRYLDTVADWCQNIRLRTLKTHASKAELFAPRNLPEPDSKQGWDRFIGRYLVALRNAPLPNLVERQAPKTLFVYDEVTNTHHAFRKDELCGTPRYGIPWRDRELIREHYALIDHAAEAHAAADELDQVSDQLERWYYDVASARASDYRSLGFVMALDLEPSILERKIGGNPNLAATSLLA